MTAETVLVAWHTKQKEKCKGELKEGAESMSFENFRLMLSRQKQYEFSFSSIIGTRENQEDYFGVISSEKSIAACVCDGMGGFADGALAGKMTVDLFCDEIAPNIDFCTAESEQFFYSVLDTMDHDVHKIKDRDGTKTAAGSTLASVFICGSAMKYVSVGDSTIYQVREGIIAQLNRIHNYQSELDEKLSAGLIDKERYEIESRNGLALTSYIGIGGGIKLADISPSLLSVEKNDMIVICSDGMTRYLDQDEIKNAVSGKSARRAVDSLMLSLAKKSKDKPLDNATVIIIRIK